MENTNKSVFNKVTVLVFLIGIVVGFGSASLWLRRSKSMSAAKENTAAAVGENAPDAGSGASAPTAEKPADSSLAQISAALSGAKNSLVVSDQPAGDTVSVSSLTLENAAWVAVHEDDNGKPGRILGAQLFPAGATHDGTVELLRGTTEKGIYYAMLHADDGDHAFDAAKDMPINGADGNPVMAKFTAQ